MDEIIQNKLGELFLLIEDAEDIILSTKSGKGVYIYQSDIIIIYLENKRICFDIFTDDNIYMERYNINFISDIKFAPNCYPLEYHIYLTTNEIITIHIL